MLSPDPTDHFKNTVRVCLYIYSPSSHALIIHCAALSGYTLFHQITIHPFTASDASNNKMHFQFLIPPLKEIPATLHQTCIN